MGVIWRNDCFQRPVPNGSILYHTTAWYRLYRIYYFFDYFNGFTISPLSIIFLICLEIVDLLRWKNSTIWSAVSHTLSFESRISIFDSPPVPNTKESLPCP